MTYDNILVDGNNLAHRARHTYNLSLNGLDVSVTYGVLRSIKSYMDKFAPKSITVCFDGGIPEFRRKAVPSYKCSRDHGDPLEYEDFLRQLRELQNLALPMCGVVCVSKAGAEADDLLAQAARMMSGRNLVITNDKDLYQVVSDTTHLLIPHNETIITPDNFEEIAGISQESYLDWRAIQGDNSDNIPGIPGIGEKTATKLFQAFTELTNITNAAAGHYPGQAGLSDRLAESIITFGFEKICKNVFVSALYADRVGARLAVLQAIATFQKAQKDQVKKYLLKMAFVSLLEGFMPYTLRLEAPQVLDDVSSGYMQMPMICAKRMPVT